MIFFLFLFFFSMTYLSPVQIEIITLRIFLVLKLKPCDSVQLHVCAMFVIL